MTDENLKPCPFCGCGQIEHIKNVARDGETTWNDGLGSPGPFYRTEEFVRCYKCFGRALNPDKWNTRTTREPDKLAMADALQDCMSGLMYVRHRYGDLDGVAFDRAINKAEAVLKEISK